MDHKRLVASLSRDQRAALLRLTNGPGLRRLAGQWGLIAMLALVIAVELPGWPLALLPLGVMLVFQFTLLHEVSHLTAFKTRWLNEAVAWVCGLVLLLPPHWFRAFHFAHHRYTQDPERDPELASPKPETRLAYLRHVSGLPVWWGQIQVLARNAAGGNADAFVPKAKRSAIQREAWLMLAAYAVLLAGSLALSSGLLIWIWLLPILLGQPFLRLYLLAEHGRCPLVANMLENSRTTFTNRLVRWLAWNMPYHGEHHSFPAVPFHRLPQFHALTRAHLATTERGYARFNWRFWQGLKRP